MDSTASPLPSAAPTSRQLQGMQREAYTRGAAFGRPEAAGKGVAQAGRSRGRTYVALIAAAALLAALLNTQGGPTCCWRACSAAGCLHAMQHRVFRLNTAPPWPLRRAYQPTLNHPSCRCGRRCRQYAFELGWREEPSSAPRSTELPLLFLQFTLSTDELNRVPLLTLIPLLQAQAASPDRRRGCRTRAAALRR